MSFDDWVEEFKPIVNPLNSDKFFSFETTGTELLFILMTMKIAPLKVWTEVEGDDNELIVTEGFHYVNRMKYYITQVPAIPNVSYEIIDE